MCNFDEIIDRNNTNSIKYGVGVLANPLLPKEHIPMWIADMDFSCPPEVLNAIKTRLDKKILGYSMILDDEYFYALNSWSTKKFNWSINKNDVFYSPGVVPALFKLVLLLTNENDGVIIQPPIYSPFLDAIKNNNRTPVYNMLINNDGHYEIDFEDLENKAKIPTNKLLLLCSPHNPTGRVWTKDELTKVAQICLNNNVKIVSDEIHCDILRHNKVHTPLDKIFLNNKNIFTCISPSKTFNLAGMHISNIIIHDDYTKAKWNEKYTDTPNPLSIEATKAAYLYCDQWVKKLNSYIDDNFKFLYKTLSEKLPQANFNIPEGTYLAWINLRNTKLTHNEILTIIARDCGIFLEGGEMFVKGGEYFIRINCACPQSILKKATLKLCEIFSNYK